MVLQECNGNGQTNLRMTSKKLKFELFDPQSVGPNGISHLYCRNLEKHPVVVSGSVLKFGKNVSTEYFGVTT